MRILLDECVPRPLKRDLTGHTVQTAAEAGFAGKSNGELLTLAQERFDVFLTVDRSIEHQQTVTEFDIAILILEARSNQLEDLAPLVPNLLKAIESARPRQVLRVSA